MSTLEERLARYATECDARAIVRAAYDRAPVEDADRSDTEEIMGREILAESPAPWPRDARTDVSVKLPERVVLTCEGVELEIGPYDFSDGDVEKLRQGLAAYDRIAHPAPAQLSRESLRDRIRALDDPEVAQ